MKKIIILLLFCISSGAYAQHSYIYVGWDINTPVGSDFVGATSSSGLKIGYRVPINEKFSVGIDFNKNTFSEYAPKETFESGNGHLTTDYFKYVYQFGIAASGQYHFKVNNERIMPYVGLGVGAVHNEYDIYYNIYTETDQAWGLVVRPEAGVVARLGRSFGVFGALTYDYTTNKSEYFGVDNFSSVGFQIGVALISRR